MFSLLGTAGFSHAEVLLFFTAGTSSYSMGPSGSLDVPIYLQQVLTNGSSSPITDGGGLFSMGIEIVQDPVSDGDPVSIFQITPNTAQFDDVQDNTVASGTATLWELQDAQFGNPVFPDTNGLIYVGTLTLHSTATMAPSTTFRLQTYPGGLDTIVTYDATALDSQVQSGSFDVVAVPEPGALAVVAGVFLAGVWVWRRRAAHPTV